MLEKIVKLELNRLKNPIFAKWQEDYLRNQFPFLGIKTPVLKTVLKKIKSEFTSNDWKKETLSLFNLDEREFHHAAIIWAILHRKKAEPDDLFLYQKLITTHSWWDTVDTIAPHLVGHLIKNFPEIEPIVESWQTSENLWLKRTSLIYPLFSRKSMNSEKLFKACKNLSHEQDFFIRKAIGWVLREHSKFQPHLVKDFVSKTPLSPLSKREALRKLNDHLF